MSFVIQSPWSQIFSVQQLSVPCHWIPQWEHGGGLLVEVEADDWVVDFKPELWECCQGLLVFCVAFAVDEMGSPVTGYLLFLLSTSSRTASGIDLHVTRSWLLYQKVTPEKDKGREEVRVATSMSSTEIFPSWNILRRQVPSFETFRRWSIMSLLSETWRHVR